MRSFYFLPVFVALMLSTTGCGVNSIKGSPDKFESYNSALLKQVENEIYINTNTNSNGQNSQKQQHSSLMQEFENCRTTEDRQKLISKLLIFIDLQYNKFRSDLYMNNTNSAFITDLALLGLGAAGAVTRVSSTQALLAALSTGVTGFRSSYSKDYLFDKTMPALIERMDNDRTVVRNRIMEKWNSDMNTYPPIEAVHDINDYFYVGTLPSAIKNLVAPAASKTLAEALDEQKKISDSKIQSMSILAGQDLGKQQTFITQVFVTNKLIKPDPDSLKKIDPKLDLSSAETIKSTVSKDNVSKVLQYAFDNTTDQKTCDLIAVTANNLK